MHRLLGFYEADEASGIDPNLPPIGRPTEEEFYKIVRAAIVWKNKYCDEEDLIAARGGCSCEVCTLIRAVQKVEHGICYKCNCEAQWPVCTKCGVEFPSLRPK